MMEKLQRLLDYIPVPRLCVEIIHCEFPYRS